MVYAGLDIGSRTIKLIALDNNGIIFNKKMPTTFDPLKSCDELLGGIDYDIITSTGYGRHLFKENRKGSIISEIKAFAIGAFYLNKECRTVLDIGGQDTKAISIDDGGNVRKFEMNDKCAAGTGRFIEIMAATLGYRYEDFADSAISADRAELINNMCTVFAESEVISLVTKGIPRKEIALGIHKTIISRSINLLKRVSIRDKVMFTGGVALNNCITNLLEKEIGTELIVPEDPQMVGALGCALHSMRENK